MQIIALLENTSISSVCKAKHGLSFYIETEHHKILFDVGPNKLFLKNAAQLDVDINTVDTLIISHGHNDHGGALGLFLQSNNHAAVYVRKEAFALYYSSVLGFKRYIGLDTNLQNQSRCHFTDELHIIDNELQLFANVEDNYTISHFNGSLYMKQDRGYVQDTFGHEQSLIIKNKNKHILVSGCAHKGIVNILDKARKLAGAEIDYVFSGFHLFNPINKKSESTAFVEDLAEKLKTYPTRFYTCHCTGLSAYSLLRERMGEQIEYIAAGTKMSL